MGRVSPKPVRNPLSILLLVSNTAPLRSWIVTYVTIGLLSKLLLAQRQLQHPLSASSTSPGRSGSHLVGIYGDFSCTADTIIFLRL